MWSQKSKTNSVIIKETDFVFGFDTQIFPLNLWEEKYPTLKET